VKVKQTAKEWLDDLWKYEDEHPIAFASPRALVETRLGADCTAMALFVGAKLRLVDF
jgi:hypothetical protein